MRCLREDREFDDTRTDLGPLPARCECGALLRPGVVWFGEALPPEAIRDAEHAAREAVLVIVAGTSSQVYPAAALPRIAREQGAWVVEINPDRTPLTPLADEHIKAPAGEALPALARLAGGLTGAVS